MFADFTSISCLVTSEDFRTVRYDKCPNWSIAAYFIVMLPFWMRLMQCLRRYHDDPTNVSQFYNAGKYASSIVAGSLNAVAKITMISHFYWLYLITRFIATFYSYGWDIYMDWGLLRASNGLRPQITFDSRFYYAASVLDLILRLTWVIPLFFVNQNWVQTFEFLTVMAMAELLRRWGWSLIRIENEQVNNFEKYRYILEVPELGSTDAQAVCE
jgi:hypothetical protein